jgi:hypothetical protein
MLRSVRRLCGSERGTARGAGAEAEESVEGDVPRSASIEAEDELVQVVLKVDPAQAVVDAQTPALEVGEQAKGPGQDDVRRHRADGDRLVLDLGDVLDRTTNHGSPAWSSGLPRPGQRRGSRFCQSRR